jgi:hypothetical protein
MAQIIFLGINDLNNLAGIVTVPETVTPITFYDFQDDGDYDFQDGQEYHFKE